MNDIEKYRQSISNFHNKMNDYKNLDDYFVFLLRNRISGDCAVLPNAKLASFEDKSHIIESLKSEWQLKNNYFFNGVDVRAKILDFLLIYMSATADSFVEFGDSIYRDNVTSSGLMIDPKNFVKTNNDRCASMLRGLEMPPTHDYANQYRNYIEYMVSSLENRPREMTYTENDEIKNIIMRNFDKVYALILKKIDDEIKNGFECDNSFKSFVLTSPFKMGIFSKESKVSEKEMNYWVQEWIINGNVKGVAFAIEKNANLDFKRFYEHPKLSMVTKDRLSAMEILKMFGDGKPWYDEVKTELERVELLNSISVIQKDDSYKVNSL